MSKISVIIPTRNRIAMVKEAIESVRRQHNVTMEILIVNDCSTDETSKKLMSEQDIRLINNTQPGNAGLNRQKAYQLATGDYVVFLDDDDFYTDDDFFSHAISHLDEDQTLVAVTSNATIWHVDDDKKINHALPLQGKVSGREYLNEFTLKYPKPWSTFTTVFRKSMLDQAGFNEMKMMNDTSIYLRALCMGDIVFLKEISGVYRVHSQNISKRMNIAFIIANLDEKMKIYDLIRRMNIVLTSDWLNQQLFTTIKYYIKESKPAKIDLYRLISWILRNRGINGLLISLKSLRLAVKFRGNQPKQQ
jgi:glycosyltransferase involved in cell wall biosynthesis